MKELRDRLRRLHRIGAETAKAPPELGDRLRRWFGGSPGAIPPLREVRLPLHERHGEVSFAAVLRADPRRLAEEARCPSLGEVSLRDLVFLDTETTSLGGGAGVLVFLAGIARVEGEELLLRQHFLPSPGGERAFLEAVRGDLAAAGAFVTFCGKSFDRHRLEDRFRFHGLPSLFGSERHLDLLHPFRRNVRGIPDHRLRTLEDRLLGLRRIDDLSGEHAPQAYFDHLAGRRGEIERVFEHNRIDVLSLVALTALLGAGRGIDSPIGEA
ncbi:MAG: ribonuclease H-like domain-containing protein [Planctomycetes bacterium]|nr:ribonuclease H-like domain-containing protein [Planctomycetota bacterium]